MRLTRRATLLSVAALLASPALVHASAPTGVAPSTGTAVQPSPPAFQPWLEQHLTGVPADTVLRVMVRGTSIDAAVAATEAVGLQVQQRWALVDIAVGVGTPVQVQALREQPGVLYVEGDTPLSYDLQTAHAATRADEAFTTYTAPDGSPVDGTGVTIAVIDSGIDGTHPFFGEDGRSKVVQNRKNACGITFVPSTNSTCFQQVPSNDTDTISVGGHGTHVAGIAAGTPVATTSPAGTELRGSGSGATLVGLSVGAAIGLLDAAAAQNWVLEHQQNPCRPAADQTPSDVDPDCPPIRVTNHSYGPATPREGGNTFDENSAAVQIQRALVDKGVVAVWAAGNSGGDGKIATTNPPAMDPTGGVLMVASYDDGQTGDPDNALSGFSSRGAAGKHETYPDLAAPGDKITSACRRSLVICQGAPSFDGGDYQTISGTSMASPYVAGVVAQLLEADPALTPAEVEDILEDSAHKFTAGAPYESDPRDPDGTTTSFDKGHGLVDVLAAVGAVQGAEVAEQEPAAPLEPRCGDGTALVADPAGDAAAPVTGIPAPGQDLTQLDFAAVEGGLAVTAVYADLSVTPVAGSTTTNHYVTWVSSDGVRYAVWHNEPGGNYVVGEFDATRNRLVAGTTAPVEGTFTAGKGGTISWIVPLELVGSPAIPVDQTTDPDAVPAVSDSYGLVTAGLGAFGSGLVYVAAVDRAPDGGATPAWSVCNSDPVLDGSDEEPPAQECTRPNGKPCKGKGKNPGNR
ncbi:MAG: S8 family serine peptidase [Mycobacteriales bacterium]